MSVPALDLLAVPPSLDHSEVVVVDLVLICWPQIQLGNVPYGLRLPFDFFFVGAYEA